MLKKNSLAFIMTSLSSAGLSVFGFGLILCSQAQAQILGFGPPTFLNSNAPTDGIGDDRHQSATDGAGNWVTVWDSTNDLGGTVGSDLDIFISLSSDNGTTWTAPTTLNTNAGSDTGADRSPQIATDGAGNWVSVWRSANNVGGTGTDDDIFVARSTDNGVTWTSPVALHSNATSDTGFDSGPKILTDGGGDWLACWQSLDTIGGTIGTDFDLLVVRSTDNGATWTAPTTLNTNAATDSGDDTAIQIATDDGTNWVAVWTSAEDLGGTLGTDVDILVARSTDSGATWSAPAALNSNAASDLTNDLSPHHATDGLGNWITVWQANDDLGGTIGTDSDILVARSTDNGATWTTMVALNTNAGSDSGSDGSPYITTDAAGQWVTAWNTNENLGGTIGTDFDILGASSTDNGSTWTAPGPINSNAASDSGSDTVPVLINDSSGLWAAIWKSREDLGGTIGTDLDILISTSTTVPVEMSSLELE